MATMKRGAQYILHRVLQEVYSVTRVTPSLAADVAVRIRQSQIAHESPVAAALIGKIGGHFISRTSPQSESAQAHSCCTQDEENSQPFQEHAETPLSSRGEKNPSPPQLLCTTEAGLTLCETHQILTSHLGETSPIHNGYTSSAFLTEHLPPSYEDTRRTTTTTTRTYHIVGSTKKEKKTTTPKVSVSHFPAESHVDDVTSTCGRRPLVVFFPWRGSNEKLRAKYCQVYQGLGLDVLCLSEGMSVRVCSQPLLIKTVTKQVMDVLQDQNEFSSRPLLIHCMSGGYMFAGSFLVNMFNQANNKTQSTPNPATSHPSASLPGNSDPSHPSQISLQPIDSNSPSSEALPNQPPLFPLSEAPQTPEDQQDARTGYLQNSVLGMVLDCPVLTPKLARRGIEFSIPNPLLSSLLRMSMSVFSPFHDPIYEAYARAMVTLDKSPKLLLYSNADNLCPVSHVQKVVSELESRGVSVEVREFPEASHVRLLGKDPEKYEGAIACFLKQLGVSVPDRGA